MPSYYTCVSGCRVGCLNCQLSSPSQVPLSVCLFPEAVLSRVTAIYKIPTFTMPLATLISSAVSPHTCATLLCIWALQPILSQHPPTLQRRSDGMQRGGSTTTMYLQMSRDGPSGTSASTEGVASMAALCALCDLKGGEMLHCESEKQVFSRFLLLFSC